MAISRLPEMVSDGGGGTITPRPPKADNVTVTKTAVSNPAPIPPAQVSQTITTTVSTPNPVVIKSISNIDDGSDGKFGIAPLEMEPPRELVRVVEPSNKIVPTTNTKIDNTLKTLSVDKPI